MRMDTFARRLNMALDERNMSAAELARLAGIGESSMSQYRNGTYEPKQRRLQRFSEILDVSIPWLMGLIDGPIQPLKEASAGDGEGSKEEAMLLQLFHAVPPESRGIVLGMIEAALKSQGLL